ncbi:Peptidase, M23 family [uncultured Eubacteriales bacterium]|uniref:Peptidase, M23 family n=1 Tax=uncultured Eubacteriales bacterium TaxID=172733 RepID=A0A212K529_9FIRM|nr:Peptidase, M23 family [uncultured Eubacteriales bacterium]
MAQKPKKQKKDRYWDGRRIVVALLALVMVLLMLLPMLTMIFSAQAATTTEIKGQISNLKGDAADMKTKKAELQGQLNALKGDRNEALTEKSLRDQELSYIKQEISNTEQQIAYYDELILDEQNNLADAQAKEEAQYDLFCQRVRAMEEAGTTSYWSVLFSADSFSELLNRAVDIQDVMDYDNAVIEQLKADRQAVADSLAALQATQAEQQDQKTLLDQQKAEQEVKVAEAAKVLKDVEADVAATQKLLDEQAAEEKRVNDEIARLQKEYDEKIKQNQIQIDPGTGYHWPLPGHYYLTSKFGWRTHPITGRPNEHTGTDISAPNGTPIEAVKGGVVTISEMGSSYGNYVVLNHGDGTSSLYAHMSARSVSVGQVVKQGAVLGYVGSTGSSTGNHLHLEIRVNGSRINPVSCFGGINFTYASSY